MEIFLKLNLILEWFQDSLHCSAIFEVKSIRWAMPSVLILYALSHKQDTIIKMYCYIMLSIILCVIAFLSRILLPYCFKFTW